MSGVTIFAMAKVMQIVFGWPLSLSRWVSSLTVVVYVTLGGLRSANFNEVLQFFLIWAGALLIPILGLYEAGGWGSLKLQIAQARPRMNVLRREVMRNLKLQIAHNFSTQYAQLWSGLDHFSANR